MNDEGSVTHLFNRLRRGDRTAMTELWEAFCPRLAGIARKTFAGRKLGSVDTEDVVLAALDTFWQRAEKGQFSGVWNRNDLWNLLATITVRKVRNQIRFEERRGAGMVFSDGHLTDAYGRTISLDEVLGEIPNQELDLLADEYLSQLDEECRMIAILRLMEYTNLEIAEQLKCSERKVERKMARIRELWKQQTPS